jgi:hypothetical protein
MTKDANSDKKDNYPEKESDLKKFLKKRSFIYLMCAVAFLVIVVPDMIAPSDLERKLVENLENDEQKNAWQIIKSYKGTDNEGSNLFDIIIIQIENAYPTEKILEHSDTILGITAINIEAENRVSFYEVRLTFQTYNDSREYIWNVDITTEEVFPVNNGARKMINIVDNYD